MDRNEHPEADLAEKKDSPSVQAVDRALLLLRLIGESNGPITIGELCSRSGLNRTTAWRLLSTLEQNHFVERNLVSKEYDLGIAATTLCMELQRRYTPLIRQAIPEMRQLMELSQETAMLSVPYSSGTMVISQIDPPRSVRLRDYVNLISPIHGTSNGKVMASFFTPSQADQFLSQSFPAHTEYTIVDPAALRLEIDKVRRLGYGTVVGEYNVEENAISAPILYRGTPIGFLGLGGPRPRFTAEQMEAIAPALCSACRNIESKLSH